MVMRNMRILSTIHPRSFPTNFLSVIVITCWGLLSFLSVCQNRTYLHLLLLVLVIITIPSPTIPTISFGPKYCFQYEFMVEYWIFNLHERSVDSYNNVTNEFEQFLEINFPTFPVVMEWCDIIISSRRFQKINLLIHDRSRDLRKCIRVQCSGPNPELHSAEMLSSPTQSTELARLVEPLIRL